MLDSSARRRSIFNSAAWASMFSSLSGRNPAGTGWIMWKLTIPVGQLRLIRAKLNESVLPTEVERQPESAPAEYDLLAVSSNHPDQFSPYRCVFNERSFQHIADGTVSTTVVSPRPFAPPVGPYSEIGNLPKVQQWEGYELHHPRFLYLLPKKLFYSLAGNSFRKRIPRYIERNLSTPDVIQANHLYIDGWGMVDYANRTDLPLIVVSHGMLNHYEEFSPLIRRRLRTVLNKADLVASVSRELAQEAERLVSDVNTEVVPIGADPERFRRHNWHAVREELCMPESKPVVLFCGQLIRRKGVDVLIDAVRDAGPTEFEMVFVSTGGELETRVRRLAAHSDHDVRIYQGISDAKLAKLFVAADLFVLPSRSEGRPTVIYEAMASETAVLASAIGGVSEQVVDGETGVLLETLTPEELSREVEELVSDQSAMQTMGRRGYERLVAKGWTWTDHGERMRAIHRRYL